jgi:predicted MFS family arabinose efflux permease
VPERVSDPVLSRYRVAVLAIFTAFGISLSTWAVHLPELQKKLAISTTALGSLLFVLGVGAIVGMQLCGPLIDKIGPERVGAVSVAVMAVSLNAPLATVHWQLASAAVFMFGMATGVTEVAMNAAAIRVERLYGRPIMASFHGVFSMSSVIGSLLSAAGFMLGVSILATTASATGIALLIIVIAWPVLSRGAQSAGWPAEEVCDSTDREVAPARRLKVVLLGVLAFLFLLAEGSAMDWSSLHAQRELGSSSAMGAVAFASFVGAMTIGRLVVDRITGAVGAVRVVRFGSALSVAGFATVMAAPNVPILLAGWLITGLGLAGGLPQVLSAAGNTGSGSARTLARVVGVGYLAILSGPGVVGWLADLTTLNVAMALPLGAVAICAIAAAAVARN